MDNVDELRDTSFLSQSYVNGVKRVTNSCRKNEKEFHISKEFLDYRERTWSSFFEKFSESSGDVELNLRTLEADNEWSDSHDFDYRVPVRKSEAQLRYWIDTGNPPCQFDEAEAEDTDVTVSISESEASELSMVVNEKLATSTDQLIDAGSSGSSVDTATYIKTNKNATKKAGSLSVEKDPRVTNFANLENNRVSRSINERIAKVVLSRSMESPGTVKILEKNPILHKSTVGDVHEKGDGVGELLSFERLKSSNLRESEVTLDSKESGIDSLPVRNTEVNEQAEKNISSDSLNEIVPTQKKSECRRRKLYTGDNSFFDLHAPAVQTFRRKRSLRYSIHPALRSVASERIKKRRFGPSLLTLPGNLKARRSRFYSANTSRAKNKLQRKSVPSKAKSLKNCDASLRKDVPRTEEPSAFVAEKIDEIEVCPSKQVDARLEESPPQSRIFNTKIKRTPKPSLSPANSSSSLGSDDVSKIINEKLYEVSRDPLANLAKKKLPIPSSSAKIQSLRGGNHANDSTGQILSDTQGSIFTPEANASPETMKTKKRNMLHTKKNLYTTDLRSSESNDSPLAPDSVDNASSTLIDNLRKEITSSPRVSKKLRKTVTEIGSKISTHHHSNPVVILHDFRSQKNCCGELDKEMYEKLIGKKNAIDERLDEKATGMKKCKKLLDHKTTTTKKLKFENNAATSRKIIANDSYSDEEFLSYLKDDGPAVDCIVVDNNDYQNKKLPDGENVTVTFITTDCEQKESIFALTSSDDENILEKIINECRSQLSKKKRDKKVLNSDEKNGSVKDGAMSQNSKLSSVNYKIVLSSSENEENTQINEYSHPAKLRKSRRKFSKVNEGKDSPDSVLTMCSRQDKCTDKSEGLQHRDEELEKQSPYINKSLETSKGKQPLDLHGGFLAAQSKVDNGPRSRIKSYGKVRTKSKKFETVVTNDSKNDLLKNKENENCTHRVSEKSEIPFDNGSNRLPKRGKDISANTTDDLKKINSTKNRKDDKLTKKSAGSLRNKRRKSSPKILTESVESYEKLEIRQTHNYKNRERIFSKDFGSRKASVDVDGGRTSDDESFSINDAMIFLSKNNAGSYSMLRDEKNDEASLIISSYKNSPSSAEGEIKIKNNVDNNTKERSTTNPEKKSKIIFRTKEYWESDSD